MIPAIPWVEETRRGFELMRKGSFDEGLKLLDSVRPFSFLLSFFLHQFAVLTFELYLAGLYQRRSDWEDLPLQKGRS